MQGDITLSYSVSRMGALDFYHVNLIANSVFSFVIVTTLMRIKLACWQSHNGFD
jgi:hypothetical protein